jgi:prepilin-type N-terminal cleavage/methylation domain-containing protein
MEQQKGFTLIELLVVIAIVAILSAVVILTLNPAELLRQSRDSNRISDLSTVKSALALYLSDVSPVFIGTSTLCYAHASSGIASGGTGCGGRFSGGTNTTSTSLAVDGTGWIPVDLTDISSGAPISIIPRDPTNSTTYYYAYRVGGTNSDQYEMNADMESTKFRGGGSGDVEGTDGGNAPTFYEVGTDPGLDL